MHKKAYICVKIDELILKLVKILIKGIKHYRMIHFMRTLWTIERRTGLQSHSNIAIIHYLILGAKVSKTTIWLCLDAVWANLLASEPYSHTILPFWAYHSSQHNVLSDVLAKAVQILLYHSSKAVCVFPY